MAAVLAFSFYPLAAAICLSPLFMVVNGLRRGTSVYWD